MNSGTVCMVEKLRTKPLHFQIFNIPTYLAKTHSETHMNSYPAKPLRKVSDAPEFSKIRPTSKSCNFLTTGPIPKFLVPRVSSSSWNVWKWYLQPDILSSTHPLGSKREADFGKIHQINLKVGWCESTRFQFLDFSEICFTLDTGWMGRT